VLENVPAPVPSEVTLSDRDGLAFVRLQHTPRAVIVAPPSSYTFPPAVATAGLAEEIVGTLVVTFGVVTVIVDVIFPAVKYEYDPYTVPIAFVAYALM
jgi:hypothetical protein